MDAISSREPDVSERRDNPADLAHTDHVDIHDLRIRTIIGIFDWERESRQEVILNLCVSSTWHGTGCGASVRLSC